MDERIRDRRRSVIRQQGRRRAGFVFVIVLVIAAAVLFLWLRSSDVFAVKRIVATAGQYLTEEQIAGLAGGALGENLLKLSTTELKEGLLSLPYVCSAEVHRRFPDTLDIRLVEHEPVARLQGKGGSTWLIAGNGRILEKVNAPRGAGLPLIVAAGSITPVVGEMLPAAMVDALGVVDLLAAEGAGRGLPAVDHIVISTAGRIVAVLKEGAELRLGEPVGLQQKLMVAEDIVEQYLREGERIQYVDLTVPERVAVKAE